MALRAQGATEYLVLLAVVLIVALVSVALLGFFPGMASDAQLTQSKTYWASTSPIAITEWSARRYSALGGHDHVYLKLKNVGMAPISITKVIAGSSSLTNSWTGGWSPAGLISGRMNLAPGEEFYFATPDYFTIPDKGSLNRTFISFTAPGGSSYPDTSFPAGAAQSYCTTTPPYGTLSVNGFGFEYIETIDGQPITKRQVGAKPLVIKCTDNIN